MLMWIWLAFTVTIPPGWGIYNPPMIALNAIEGPGSRILREALSARP